MNVQSQWPEHTTFRAIDIEVMSAVFAPVPRDASGREPQGFASCVRFGGDGA